jgi:drug/metabolite transporter (DMT)-like permease
MQEYKQESSANRFEIACQIVLLTLLAIAVYVGSIFFLGRPISRYMPVWFLSTFCLFSILALGLFSMVGLKFWRPKTSAKKTLKKIVCVSIFAFFASLLTHWLLIKVLREIL